MTAPRPALAVVTAARAISSGQAGPGSAVQAARAGRPAASAPRNDGPVGYLVQGPASGRGGLPPAGRANLLRAAFAAAASVAAWRCGTASRSTSARVPAYRSATARARPAI